MFAKWRRKPEITQTNSCFKHGNAAADRKETFLEKEKHDGVPAAVLVIACRGEQQNGSRTLKTMPCRKRKCSVMNKQRLTEGWWVCYVELRERTWG
jgi:hypothetical protein